MKQPRCRTCDARVRCVFSHLAPEHRAELRSLSQSFVYGRGFPLFRQGDEATGVYIVHAGWVKLAYCSAQGGGANLGLAGPGSVLGLAQVMVGTRHPVGAEVVQPSEFAHVDGKHFIAFLERHPNLTRRLLRLMSREQGRLLSELCETAGKLPAQERLLHVLDELAGQCGQDTREGVRIGLPLTVQDLGERIGCSRQWTSRLLGELEESGRVVRRRGWYFLPHGAGARDPRTSSTA